MKRNSKLSAVLHVLLHLAEFGRPVTSAEMARMMGTNPVVVRRSMAGLREAGLVLSEKGHGGGWQLAENWQSVTLGQVHAALGGPRLIAASLGLEGPECAVEQTVNAALGAAFDEAEALLVARLGSITLGALAGEFHHKAHKWHSDRKDFDHGH